MTLCRVSVGGILGSVAFVTGGRSVVTGGRSEVVGGSEVIGGTTEVGSVGGTTEVVGGMNESDVDPGRSEVGGNVVVTGGRIVGNRSSVVAGSETAGSETGGSEDGGRIDVVGKRVGRVMLGSMTSVGDGSKRVVEGRRDVRGGRLVSGGRSDSVPLFVGGIIAVVGGRSPLVTSLTIDEMMPSEVGATTVVGGSPDEIESTVVVGSGGGTTLVTPLTMLEIAPPRPSDNGGGSEVGVVSAVVGEVGGTTAVSLGGTTCDEGGNTVSLGGTTCEEGGKIALVMSPMSPESWVVGVFSLAGGTSAAGGSSTTPVGATTIGEVGVNEGMSNVGALETVSSSSFPKPSVKLEIRPGRPWFSVDCLVVNVGSVPSLGTGCEGEFVIVWLVNSLLMCLG
jgi:hypothetical protein